MDVYSPPTRGYNFDTDFLTPSLLPPAHADVPRRQRHGIRADHQSTIEKYKETVQTKFNERTQNGRNGDAVNHSPPSRPFSCRSVLRTRSWPWTGFRSRVASSKGESEQPAEARQCEGARDRE